MADRRERRRAEEEEEESSFSTLRFDFGMLLTLSSMPWKKDYSLTFHKFYMGRRKTQASSVSSP
jgi:hypothetical protein